MLKRLVYAAKMATVRDAWTDERLDDLTTGSATSGAVWTTGFNRVETTIDGLRAETDSKIGGLRIEMKTEFVAVRQEIAGLHRLMVQLAAGIIATIVATQIASKL